MLTEIGYWELDTEIKKTGVYTYFVAKHICNPSKIEIVFIQEDGSLKGKKELIEFIEKEKLI